MYTPHSAVPGRGRSVSRHERLACARKRLARATSPPPRAREVLASGQRRSACAGESLGCADELFADTSPRLRCTPAAARECLAGVRPLSRSAAFSAPGAARAAPHGRSLADPSLTPRAPAGAGPHPILPGESAPRTPTPRSRGTLPGRGNIAVEAVDRGKGPAIHQDPDAPRRPAAVERPAAHSEEAFPGVHRHRPFPGAAPGHLLDAALDADRPARELLRWRQPVGLEEGRGAPPPGR